ncbi:MAG: HNH endonuclease, partial [Deltaproteobacteria bacterium]
LRRAVLLRDQRRCQVPGCTNTRWLDVHHLELRSEGGRHSLANLTCLCSTHHRASHRGKIALARSDSGALHVRHADGTDYGQRVQPQALEVRAKVFSALRNLGFREAQVRAALEQLQRESALEQTPFDGLLREALARLRSPGVGR